MKTRVFVREMVLPVFWLYFIMVFIKDQPLHDAGYQFARKDNNISLNNYKTLIPLPGIYFAAQILKEGVVR